MAVTHDASIVAVMGQSGQGKGVWIKRRLTERRPPRLLVWDPMNEYGEFARGQPSLSHLVSAVIRAGKRAPFAARYRPKADKGSPRMAQEFAVFCKLAMTAGGCCVLAEELSFVTRPSYAPPAWASVCNAGRHEGLEVIGASQFPAQIDKSILSNATEVVCFYLGEEPHRKVVATKINRRPQEIEALRQFHYLHFDRDRRTVTEGHAYPPGYAPQAPSGPAPAAADAPTPTPTPTGNATPSGPPAALALSPT